ncbi:hypothetical protein shim_03170 [Shimia sp. SK013]|uniref:hypothetical protein n=1 Tax=Shimia sp. SK013 TaxID=1389006 RepID=UPI0006B52899|nr:hypothetical protein [Shimia sp. SK013]KPA23383.1 hypothetical protein shim_03170 [Shimia sp. SK013]
MKKSLSAIIGLITATSAMSADVSVGDVFLCTSEHDLPPVAALVGKLETWGDLEIGGEVENKIIAHLQLTGISETQELPTVFHSPFALEAIAPCLAERIDQGKQPQDPFLGGRDEWLTAVRKSEAGVFSISPAQAYWMILGVVDQNGGFNQ